MKLASLQQEQMEWIELNEAFAAQSLAVIRELKLDEERVRSTLNVLLKFEDDIESTDDELRRLIRESSTD